MFLPVKAPLRARGLVFGEDGESVPLGEAEAGVGAKEFVGGAGGAGEFGVVVIMNDDNSLRSELGSDKGERGLDGGVEVAVAKGEGDLFW